MQLLYTYCIQEYKEISGKKYIYKGIQLPIKIQKVENKQKSNRELF